MSAEGVGLRAYPREPSYHQNKSSPRPDSVRLTTHRVNQRRHQIVHVGRSITQEMIFGSLRVIQHYPTVAPNSNMQALSERSCQRFLKPGKVSRSRFPVIYCTPLRPYVSKPHQHTSRTSYIHDCFIGFCSAVMCIRPIGVGSYHCRRRRPFRQHPLQDI
jgi:hypothetical protein